MYASNHFFLKKMAQLSRCDSAAAPCDRSGMERGGAARRPAKGRRTAPSLTLYPAVSVRGERFRPAGVAAVPLERSG